MITLCFSKKSSPGEPACQADALLSPPALPPTAGRTGQAKPRIALAVRFGGGGRQPKRPLPWRLFAMATGAIWWRGLFWPCASCQNVRQSLAPLGVPVALAYCTLCGSGILYEIKVAGRAKPFVFESSGFLCRSNRLMFVRATLSLWNQFARG